MLAEEIQQSLVCKPIYPIYSEHDFRTSAIGKDQIEFVL